LSAAGLIPGYYATFLLIDKWGRRPIQLMGFIMLTIIFVIMGKLAPFNELLGMSLTM
jgi:PHS family inorganic phosphate transporter-like MFS transporter